MNKHALSCSVGTMATFAGQVFSVALFLFVFVKLGSCLQCYTCTSGPDQICDDQFSHHAHQTVRLVTCENSPLLGIIGAGPNIYCGKSKKTVSRSYQDVSNINDYIFRGCVPENYCRLVKSEVSECEVCETERCNSSSVLTPYYIFGIISFLLVKLNM